MGRSLAGEVPADLHHRSIRDLDALDTSVKQRIGKTLLRYESDPLSHAEPLTQSELGSYRFRIGDYRVVFDIEGDEMVILRIDHRRDIYRR
jgi:mRNA interferase RelE/StbE